MGINKLLLDMGGQTIVERAVDALLRSKVDRLIVVVGFEWEKIRRQLHERNVRVVHNRQYREGMAASIRKGLRHIGQGSDGVLIALADHPLMTSDLINQLIEAFRKTYKGILCPTYQGRRGHPVIFDLKKYGKTLSQLKGDIGGRALIEAHRDDVLEFAVDSLGVIRDIDVWEDYEESRKLLTGEFPGYDEKNKG